MTGAARAMTDRKTIGHASYRVATRLQSFCVPTMISIRFRRLYLRLSYFNGFLLCFRPEIQVRIPLPFNAFLNQTSIIAPEGEDRRTAAID